MNGPSQRHLLRWGLREETFYHDLATGLEQNRLFLKPKTLPKQIQKYHYVIAYPEEDGLDAIEVHVTLSPKGEPPSVKVAVYPSDTARSLPRILIKIEP